MNNATSTVSPGAIFLAFLKLGLTSFGGPIAHIGYFRMEFVEQRGWVTEAEFAQLLATSQFLPGPASSQLGFSIGLLKAGWIGAFAAFIAFTMPSVLLLIAFAGVLPMLAGEAGQALLHGLKLVACIVVADAVISMAKSLCPDWQTRAIAIASLLILLLLTTVYAQILVLGLAALVGVIFLGKHCQTRATEPVSVAYGAAVSWMLLVCFVVLLVTLPLLASSQPGLVSIADTFYRAGALVFGGGHVILPLLDDSIVGRGWVTEEEFLAGYGAAQAIPGPMFAFSAYLGMLIDGEQSNVASAAIATLFMFLPGFLLMAAVLPFWRTLSQNRMAAAVIKSVNAAVVGLLAAALYDPIFTSGITALSDIIIVLLGFMLLFKWRVSPLIIVVFCVSATLLQTVMMTL